MAGLPPTNAMSQDELFTKQGAIVSQPSENARIATVVPSENTNIAHVTENSENKRIETIKANAAP